MQESSAQEKVRLAVGVPSLREIKPIILVHFVAIRYRAKQPGDGQWGRCKG